MTKKELIVKFQEDIRSGDFDVWEESDNYQGATLEVEDEWGGEGQGDEVGYIFKFNFNNEQFFVRVLGHYNSHEGSDYSYADVDEVESYPKTITAWRTVESSK